MDDDFAWAHPLGARRIYYWPFGDIAYSMALSVTIPVSIGQCAATDKRIDIPVSKAR